MNALEARFMFNEVLIENNAIKAVERRATVVMSLPHFVAMAQVIMNQLPKARELAIMFADGLKSGAENLDVSPQK